MDVRFINPFLYGTEEVLSKMVSISPVAGKPFVKTDDTAHGDVSGIIGMTGDAVGSLAITFSEESIIYIAGKMLGENYKDLNREVLDTVGELTNMISGAARKMMEKDNLKVIAAIPTIVFGKSHTVRHIVKGPSIVIPFSTEKGSFVLDICLQSQIKQKEAQLPANKSANTKIAESGKPSLPKTGPGIITQEKIEIDLNKPIALESKDIGERLHRLKQILSEVLSTRETMEKQLRDQPFMETAQRMRYKKALPAYEVKIKRLKLDISAAETLFRMSKEDLENPKIKPHFQHYPTKQATPKPENKK